MQRTLKGDIFQTIKPMATFTLRLPSVCKDCKNDKNPHKAHGFCDTCYRRYLRSKEKQDVDKSEPVPLTGDL